MASIRNIAKCIELSGNMSIIRDFLGYARRPPKSISLLNHLKLLKGRHIHLNIIHVGSNLFTPANNDDIADAIQIARERYAQINLGIGRIRYYDIDSTVARGREVINSDAEAITLTREWTVPNNAFDVFIVLRYDAFVYIPPRPREHTGIWKPVDTVGRSATKGPCNKNSSCVMTGSVVCLEIPGLTGDILAHEVGHYLGLSHDEDNSNNLMYPSVPNGGTLTADQGSKMMKHCFTMGACS
jgi:hypothetical protein